MKFTILALVLAGLLAGCSANNDSQTSEPSAKAAAAPDEETVSLKVGEAIAVSALAAQIGFDTVLEDSRCPEDVECVWAGNARVGLRLVADEVNESFELNTSEQRGATTYLRAGYALSIDRLDPQPKSTEGIDPKFYRLTLKLQKQ